MLSPIDIQNKEFRKARIGGYHTEEVNEFLDEVLDAYQTITKENHELKDKLNMLNENIQYYRTMEATIQNALVLAEKTAQDTKTLAYEKAEQIKKEAERKAEDEMEKARGEIYLLKQKIEDLKKRYLAFKVQMKQSLNTQLELLEQQDIITAVESEKEAVEESLSEEFSTEELSKEGFSKKESLEQQATIKTIEEAAISDEEAFYTKEYTILEEGK
jgi:cell division initiation protein